MFKTGKLQNLKAFYWKKVYEIGKIHASLSD